MTEFYIVETDRHCVVRTYQVNGRVMQEEVYAGLPQIISLRDGYLAPANQWLMKRFADDDLAPGTVRADAMAIRSFLQYLDALGRDWMTVDDAALKAWRSSVRLRHHHVPRRRARGARAHKSKSTPTSTKHVNDYLNSVFQFFVWCEETGRIKGVVNLDGRGQPARGMINCRNVIVRTRDNERRVVRRCALLLRKAARLPRRTPSDDDITKIHQHLTGKHAERNALILLVAEETGARRGDILQIKTAMLPDLERINKATREGTLIPLLVLGKNRVERQINLKPGTALLLRQWVDLEREAIVERAKDRDESYEEPPEVFLSDRGTPLNPNWVSNIVTKLFRAAGVDKSSLHRLRAAFLTRLTDGFVSYRDANGEPLPLATIHFYVREIAGWSSLSSLENYVTAAYRRSLTTAADTRTGAFSEEELVSILAAGP